MSTRVGLLVPSSNTVVEADFYRSLPASTTIHTARMLLETTTVEAEEVMLDEYTFPAVRLLATAKPDMVVFACTSAGALRGNSYDAELCSRITDVTGVPTVSVIRSVQRVLGESAGSSVAVLTPYVDELNQRIQTSLEDDGFNVTAMHGMGITNNFHIAQVEPPAIVEFARQCFGSQPPADALFVSCTNFQAVSARHMLQELYGIPVVTSNQAALEVVRRELSIETVAG